MFDRLREEAKQVPQKMKKRRRRAFVLNDTPDGGGGREGGREKRCERGFEEEANQALEGVCVRERERERLFLSPSLSPSPMLYIYLHVTRQQPDSTPNCSIIDFEQTKPCLKLTPPLRLLVI